MIRGGSDCRWACLGAKTGECITKPETSYKGKQGASQLISTGEEVSGRKSSLLPTPSHSQEHPLKINLESLNLFIVSFVCVCKFILGENGNSFISRFWIARGGKEGHG